MNIWIPKLKIVEAELTAPKGRVSGWFHAQVFNSAGALVREYKRKNLVTNGFFTATSNHHRYAAVGTGSPTFTASSTALAAQTGSRAAFGSTTYGNVDATAFYYYETADFGLGGINGNLTEFGVFTGATGSNMTFCDLIRDSGGSPTTFPVTSDEQLRLTHGVEVSMPTSTSSGSFTIGGSAGSGSHDYEMVAQALGTPSSEGDVLAAILGGFNETLSSSVSLSTKRAAFRGVTGAGAPNTNGYASYDGSPVLINNGGGSYSGTFDRTTPGEVSVATTLVYGLSQSNHVDGISGLTIGGVLSDGAASAAATRIAFDPPIPKFAGSIQRILTLNFRATGKAA